MSNTNQFKPGDRVRVGAPTEDDQYDCGMVVRDGAVGFLIDSQPDESWLVQFTPRDPLVNKCHDWRWFIDPRRLTLVDEKPVEPVTPAAPIPNDGGPAFPQLISFNPNGEAVTAGMYFAEGPGMSLRQYAAIKLCVPDSGTPWLDEMIRKSLKDRFAGQALAGIMPSDGRPDGDNNKAQWANEIATAMMERRAK